MAGEGRRERGKKPQIQTGSPEGKGITGRVTIDETESQGSTGKNKINK
jgi:hypothetical protein